MEFTVILIIIVGLVIYILSRNSKSSVSNSNSNAENAKKVDEPVDTSEAIATISTAKKMANIWSEITPLTTQVQNGLAGKEIPEGGIFDPYIRGYYLGYVDSLIAISGGGGIDISPHIVAEIFSVMYGAGFGDEEAGIEILNECLKDRNESKNDGDDSPFLNGFSCGTYDYKEFHEGGTPQNLSIYISKTI